MNKVNYQKYKDDIINNITDLISINSVLSDPNPNEPFGKGPALALKYMQDLANKLGFKTTNYDNYCLEIDFDFDAKETLAILVHVDVVPADDKDWKTNPFKGTIIDNKIYGRGALDDKGPAIINLFAMKAIKDASIKLNKNIKMIVGANEETGSKCLEYYFDVLKKPQPTIAYTPDAEFPVIFAEKGIIRLDLITKFKTLNNWTIKGGNAYNSVPSSCVVKKDNQIIFETKGVAAHAAMPELGINAISKLFNEWDIQNINNDELKQLKSFFNRCIKNETNGNSLKIKCEDEQSHDLTLNVGFINLENNELKIGIDIRCPVTINIDQIIETIKNNLDDFLELKVVSIDKPLYIPRDDFLVKTLMDIYKQHTHDNDAKPLAIGGGTYARKVKHGVAFGALLKEQENNMHQANEYLDISYIETIFNIYFDAIIALCK